MLIRLILGLYTDESPGLKVDPVVVLVLSIVFIFSVVALHGMRPLLTLHNLNILLIPTTVIAKITRRFSS
jgi:hypothetical protein